MSRRLILIAVTAVLAACGGAPGTSDTTLSTTPAADTTTTAGGTTTTGAGSSAAVSVAMTDLGDILVDPDGFTMYVFTNDTDGESTCYDGCAALWPPVPADVAIGPDLDASTFGSTTRTDGSEQLTVDGQPLYLYTPDTAPGATTGQGVGGVWFVVGADGTMIGASADTTATDPPGDGY